MHLIVTIFYNDGLYGTLLALIRSRHLSSWEWVLAIMELPSGKELGSLYQEFRDATKDELWERKGDLERFIHQPGIIGKYLDGTIGNNLLFVYKSRALTECLDDLTTLAIKATKELFSRNNLLDDLTNQFIDDAGRYHHYQMKGIFSDCCQKHVGMFHFDIAQFESDGRTQDIQSYYCGASAIPISFELTTEQEDIIKRYSRMYGTSQVGLGRILSRVYLRKLFRRAVRLDHDSETLYKVDQPSASSQGIKITGLGS